MVTGQKRGGKVCIIYYLKQCKFTCVFLRTNCVWCVCVCISFSLVRGSLSFRSPRNAHTHFLRARCGPLCECSHRNRFSRNGGCARCVVRFFGIRCLPFQFFHSVQNDRIYEMFSCHFPQGIHRVLSHSLPPLFLSVCLSLFLSLSVAGGHGNMRSARRIYERARYRHRQFAQKRHQQFTSIFDERCTTTMRDFACVAPPGRRTLPGHVDAASAKFSMHFSVHFPLWVRVSVYVRGR